MIKNKYILDRNENIKTEKERNNYIFGILLGAIWFWISIFLYLKLDYGSILEIFGILLILMASSAMLAVTIYPNALSFVYKIINKIFSKMGKIILNLILIALYYLLVFPIGTILKVKENKSKEKSSNFVDYHDMNINSKNVILKTLKFIKALFNEKFIIMLPFVMILIILGILLFFAQSSIVAPFIYTLF